MKLAYLKFIISLKQQNLICFMKIQNYIIIRLYKLKRAAKSHSLKLPFEQTLPFVSHILRVYPIYEFLYQILFKWLT